jgi:LPS sulfotransferase NodH
VPRFLLVAHERSGSSWLVDGLRPACLGEIWGPDLIHRRWCDPRGQPVLYFRESLAASEQARGAKLMMHAQLGNEAASELLQEVDRVILLGRLNLTESAVSMHFARRFNDWQRVKARPTGRVWPQRANINELRQWLHRLVNDRREWNVMLTEARVPVLRLWYEWLTTDAVNSARSFVGLKNPVSVISNRQQQRNEEFYRRAIINYDEINDALGKRYGVLFGQPGDWWRTDYPPIL